MTDASGQIIGAVEVFSDATAKDRPRDASTEIVAHPKRKRPRLIESWDAFVFPRVLLTTTLRSDLRCGSESDHCW